MKHLLFSSFLFSFFFCSAQNNLVKQWDKRFGGNDWDQLFAFQQTNDGGYILGGYTRSDSSGDVSQISNGPLFGQMDQWLLKTDSLGNKQWDKRFGGNYYDYLYTLGLTKDGGYILGGWTYSDSSGDVSQHTRGHNDYWIVKTDSIGNKQWDKRFGGDSTDYLYSIQQTNDEGYILGGWTHSGITGDVSQPKLGGSDYWLVKTDSAGNKIWDKRFGGTGDDLMFLLQQISDGGYILGGYTDSEISNDVSEYPRGGKDYWILKTDFLGNKIWDRRFGGSNNDELHSLQQTSDGGYILGGTTNSDSTGEVLQHTRGGYDFWIIKIDSFGYEHWNRLYGGAALEDDFGHIKQTNDGGFLFGGGSYSNLSGDKTENNLGIEQTWLVKIDDWGNKEWDKTLFTNGHDEGGYPIQTKGGCYAIANYTNANIGGYNTQLNRGGYDFWLIKLCDTTFHCNLSSTTIDASQTIFCANDSAQICVQSGFTSYLWNNGATTSCITTNLAGNYYVTVTDNNGCSAESNHLAITVYSLPSVSISVNGDTLSAYNAITYQWYFNGSPINGANSSIYISNQAGFYSVEVTDTNGCHTISNPIVVSGIDNLNSTYLFVSPNPFISSISISLQKENLQQADFTITNIIGQPVYTKHESNLSSTYTKTLELGYLPAGVYFLEIIAGGERSVRQLVKQ